MGQFFLSNVAILLWHGPHPSQPNPKTIRNRRMPRSNPIPIPTLPLSTRIRRMPPLTLFPALPFRIQLGFGECLALTLFPPLPKIGNNIKTKTSKTKMYSVCAVGPGFSPCKRQGFSWLAQFGIVNHLNLLCCVPTSCMCMPIVALHWKVGVKLG